MKIINLPHKVCDYTCFINGLEDIYEWKTGIRLPDYLLYLLGGMSGFSYISNKNAIPSKMVFWGNSMKMFYDSLSHIVGFESRILENRTYSFTLKKIIECIDKNYPVMLGAIDMFHLPYYDKFYHKMHIPIHYVLVVGYDNKNKKLFVNDCGMEDTQSVPFSDIEKAMNIYSPGISKKNTIHIFKFRENISNIKEIVIAGLQKRSEFMLTPPVKFLGIPGILKLSDEIVNWPKIMTKNQLKKCLLHFVEYTGSVVPMLPQKVVHYKIDENFEIHKGNRDKFSKMLNYISNEFGIGNFEEPAEFIAKSGTVIQEVTDHICDVINGKSSNLFLISKKLKEIANLETAAYKQIIFLVNSKY